jgi:hypothetical protein
MEKNTTKIVTVTTVTVTHGSKSVELPFEYLQSMLLDLGHTRPTKVIKNNEIVAVTFDCRVPGKVVTKEKFSTKKICDLLIANSLQKEMPSMVSIYNNVMITLYHRNIRDFDGRIVKIPFFRNSYINTVKKHFTDFENI